MGNKYLVSICIPTYNRATCLKRCLESLIRQPEFLHGDVEIVVSDNCSTDNTREVVQKYRAKYANIKYYKNEKNIVIRNFPACLMRGEGILRKLNGDTALFKRGSLRLLCDAVRKYNETRPILFWGNGNLKNITCQQTDTLNDFLLNTSFQCTWMDTFSIWESDCKDLLHLEDKCDTWLWQSWAICYLLKGNRSAVLFNNKIITRQLVYKKDVSYGIFKVFYCNFLGIFRPLVKSGIITQQCFDYLEKDVLFNLFIDAIIEWELNHDYYKFSGTENLKAAVWYQYRRKPYFRQFALEYSKRYARAKLKMKIKKIPILGNLLVTLKHTIQGR